jgi:hypothetical protein
VHAASGQQESWCHGLSPWLTVALAPRQRQAGLSNVLIWLFSSMKTTTA